MSSLLHLLPFLKPFLASFANTALVSALKVVSTRQTLPNVCFLNIFSASVSRLESFFCKILRTDSWPFLRAAESLQTHDKTAHFSLIYWNKIKKMGVSGTEHKWMSGVTAPPGGHTQNKPLKLMDLHFKTHSIWRILSFQWYKTDKRWWIK